MSLVHDTETLMLMLTLRLVATVYDLLTWPAPAGDLTSKRQKNSRKSIENTLKKMAVNRSQTAPTVMTRTR